MGGGTWVSQRWEKVLLGCVEGTAHRGPPFIPAPGSGGDDRVRPLGKEAEARGPTSWD